MVGRGREKWRKDRDEKGANRARKRRNPGQLRWEDEGAAEEVEEEAERRIGRGPRRRYPSRTAG